MAQGSETRGAAPYSAPKEEPPARWEARLWSLLAPRSLDALPAPLKYALAMAIVVAATALRWALIPVLGTTAPYSVSFAALVVTTLLFGIGPGLAAAVLGVLAVEGLVLRSLPTSLEWPALARLGVTLAIGVLIAWLFNSIRISAVKARRAEAALRESEERIQQALRVSRSFTFEWDPGTDTVERSASCGAILKLSGDEAVRDTSRHFFERVHPDDRGRFVEMLHNLTPAASNYVTEYRVTCGDGSVAVLEEVGQATFDASGALARLAGVTTDITARQAAEEAVRLSEQKFSTTFHSNASAMVLTRVEDGRVVDANEAWLRLVGHSREEIIGRTAREHGIWKNLSDREEMVQAIKSTGSIHDLEAVCLDRDGREHTVLISGQTVTVHGERLLLTSAVEITARKRAEEALHQNQALLQAVLDNTPDGIFLKDRDSRLVLANPATLAIIGRPAEAVIGKTDAEFYDDAATARAILENDQRIMRSGQAETVEESLTDAQGTRIYLSSKAAYRNSEGRVIGLIGVARDITDRKKAEEALRASERRFRQVAESLPQLVWTCAPDGPCDYLSPQWVRYTGKSEAEQLGYGWLEQLHPGDRRRTVEQWQASAARGENFETEFRIRRHDGTYRWFRTLAVPLRNEAGRVVKWFGSNTDIDDIKRAEELRRALAEQEKLSLGAAVEQASDSIVMVDLGGTIRYVNAAFESINRMARAAAAGTSYFDLLAGEPAAAAAIREAVAAGRPWHGPLTRSVADGRPVELEVTISPTTDPSGAVIGGLITEKDVTRENALQNLVRQAQKMEALGTLAGGITHDFNNILGTIVINTELALLDLDPTDPARQNLPLVLRAANRGKELVKQIITFSRQRTWERKPHEIAPLIKEDLKFLRTTLPKNIGIQETIDARSGIVLADPSHVHQVFVNLCQNAALAMKDRGGRLGISLEPVEVDEAMTARHPSLKPGPYARLTVSDTGCGMTKEVRERIFEPFFTTRGPGEGSGLGLAVVHGIVRTYDGEITVDSEPEEGSTFKVYFPRLEGEKPAADAEDHTGPLRGQERILLVEDEKPQRESLERGLGHLGYRVTARADGRSALTVFKKDPSAFDLVITDQVMPKLTGLDLASAISALRPDIPIILCTGFSEKVNGEVVGKSGVRDFIMKPYTIRDLTTLIRKVLAKTAAPSDASK